MVAIVVIILCLVGWGVIKGYEYFLKQSYIAKIVDGQKPPENFISEEAQDIISMIKDTGTSRVVRYTDCIELKDGQRICYLTDPSEKEVFIRKSNLRFAPTDIEWEVLRLIVRKTYPKIVF